MSKIAIHLFMKAPARPPHGLLDTDPKVALAIGGIWDLSRTWREFFQNLMQI
jgi:hypothetical protein